MFLAALVLVWEIFVRLSHISSLLVPSPEGVWGALAEGFTSGTIPRAVLASMGRMLIGYGLAVAIGLPLGVAIARVSAIRDTIGAAAMGLQTLPSICWLPMALLWFGLSEKAVIFVVVMGATFSITTAVDDGIRNVSPLLIKAGRTLGARGLRLQTAVVLPAALPTIVTGLKLGWSFAWRSLMAGELLYSEQGLGRVLTTGRDLQDMAQVASAIIVILALGLLINAYVFGPVERALANRYGLTGD
ncbi:MAG TPA: ABC transporter permease [Armatimonadota bacterium]